MVHGVAASKSCISELQHLFKLCNSLVIHICMTRLVHGLTSALTKTNMKYIYAPKNGALTLWSEDDNKRPDKRYQLCAQYLQQFAVMHISRKGFFIEK